MKLHKQFFILLLFVFFDLTVYAQISKRRLDIGDLLPIEEIEFYDSYNNRQLKFSELKDKLVILHFWGPDCPGCVQELPRFDSLKFKYENKVEIVNVSSSTQDEIDNAFNKRKIYSKYYRFQPTLKSITGDTILHKMFREFKLIPHNVWIDTGGKIRAFTYSDEVNEENIERMLIDSNFMLPPKIDDFWYDNSKRFLPQVLPKFENHVKYHSIFFQDIRGLFPTGPRIEVDSLNQTITIRRKSTFMQFVGEIFGGFGTGDIYNNPVLDYGKRVVFEISDSTFLKRLMSDDKFIYEASLPLMDEPSAYSHFLEDIERYFGVNFRIEKRHRSSLSIVRTSQNDKIKYKGSDPRKERLRMYVDTLGHFHLNAVNIESLRREMSDVYKSSQYIVLDKTGYNDLVQITLVSEFSNIDALRLEMQKKYDLDILSTDEEINVLIVEPRNQDKIHKRHFFLN